MQNALIFHGSLFLFWAPIHFVFYLGLGLRGLSIAFCIYLANSAFILLSASWWAHRRLKVSEKLPRGLSYSLERFNKENEALSVLGKTKIFLFESSRPLIFARGRGVRTGAIYLSRAFVDQLHEPELFFYLKKAMVRAQSRFEPLFQVCMVLHFFSLFLPIEMISLFSDQNRLKTKMHSMNVLQGLLFLIFLPFLLIWDRLLQSMTWSLTRDELKEVFQNQNNASSHSEELPWGFEDLCLSIQTDIAN